jgi:NADH-quinone oxidoreductase subunit I
MSCQICVEVCPFHAIKMDTDYELSTTNRFSALQWDKQQLSKSNEHYHKIHPTEAAAVDAQLAAERAKVAAKAKAAAEAKPAAPTTATNNNGAIPTTASQPVPTATEK